MKNVCLFNYPAMDDFFGYRIETFDPMRYFPKDAHWPLEQAIAWGLNGYRKRRAITLSAAGVDKLYRERDPAYREMIGDFVDRFRHFDLIVMSTYNFIHPEILTRELSKPIKVLGFIDDPTSPYLCGIPYLWAFDGAFYVSPSYIDDQMYSDAMRRWGDKPAKWWPLVPFAFERPACIDDDFFRKREVQITYVGNPTGSKLDRLIMLKRHFGARMRVHGRWRFKGYIGMLRGVFGNRIYPHRVSRLSVAERTHLYWNSQIGFNMHVSDTPYETGNMRMYEIPAHGMLMVCDKAGAGAHNRIFEGGKEALYYDNIDEAIELIESHLVNHDERLRIAVNGFERYWRDYGWSENLKTFLDWAISIRGSPVS